jgi:hypothetical protein
MTTALNDTRKETVDPPARRQIDVWALLAGAVATTFVLAASKPLQDPDIWWHVRTGELILRHGVPHKEPWAFTAMGRSWTPTSWLSDAALAAIHDVFGWRGIIILKTLLGAILLFALFRMLFATTTKTRIAAPVFILVAVTLSPFIAERPQLISLCLVVWLAHTVRDGLLGKLPSWWVVPVTYAWANIHGMWILSPICLLLVALGAALDRRPDWRRLSGRSASVALAALVVASLTPAGPRLVFSSIMIHRAAGDVSEWQRTNLLDHYSVFLLALMLVWVVAVARSGIPTPPSEILWMGAMFVFALVAARNIAPVAILVSPFVVSAVDRTFGARIARAAPPPALPRSTGWLVVSAGFLALVTLVAQRPPVVAGLPTAIVANLMERPGPVRVLNSYVVGGYLTGAGAPHISVAIDGRTENYDPKFVHRYFMATTRMVGWRSLLADLKPQVAVIGKNSQLAEELRREGWTVKLTDGDFALLEPPVGP